jgi:hypothetical protein
MAAWTQFADEAPEIAEMAERRLAATGLFMLATLRHDKLWLGMMIDSTKSRDLKRDGRCSLHTATADKQVSQGDVKLWGTATAVTDHDTLARFSDDIFESVGFRFEVGSFDAFDIDLLGASSVSVADDVLYVKTWKPGKGVSVSEKRD